MNRVARVLASLFVLGALIFVVGWFTQGGRWFVVRTPSMGTAAPVGTLLWVHPVSADELRTGDVISFRPPGQSAVYTHRIHAVHADGTLTTKGDITSPDPWRLPTSDVLGKVEARWWAMGWLVRAAPLLLGAAAVLWLVCRLVSEHRRRPLLLLGISITFSVALVIYKPLTDVERLGPSDGKSVALVSTGLLPVRVDVNGESRTLHTGETTTVTATPGRRAAVSAEPDFQWWGWLLLVAGCLTPASWTTARESMRPKAAGRHRN